MERKEEQKRASNVMLCSQNAWTLSMHNFSMCKSSGGDDNENNYQQKESLLRVYTKVFYKMLATKSICRVLFGYMKTRKRANAPPTTTTKQKKKKKK